MAADDGIEPVGDVECAVCAHGDVARPKPFAPVLFIDSIPDVIGIRCREARHQFESLQREAGAARLRVKTKHDVAAGIGAEQHALILSPEQIALVPDDAGWGSGAGIVAGRQDAGIVLVPVCRERILTRPSIGLPEPGTVGVEVTGVRLLHQPRHPACHHLIVVVVLPEIAERVDRQFVRVPKIVREHGEPCAVRLDSQRHAPRVHAPVVTHHPTLVLQVVGRAAGVEAAGTQRPARTIGAAGGMLSSQGDAGTSAFDA